MKRLSVLALCALGLLVNACEKHPASQLPAEHATEFGKHAAGHDGEEHGEKTHEPKAAAEHAPEGKPVEAAKPASEAKPGEAPKFFPEKK